MKSLGVKLLKRNFGAKKKKDGSQGVQLAASSDIVNIWKDRNDPVIRPLD